MRIEVKVPVLPESVAEATLVNWHKKAGQSVKRDENLIDIETDKVVLELPAPDAGVLIEIRKPDGSTVTAQEVIAVIDTDGKATEAAPAAPVAPTAKAPAETTTQASASPSPSRAVPSAPPNAAPTASATACPRRAR
jgi:2-oxoglutarate dehydrogenase E2 component (dihydrolipoamide succinyltransferase)